MKERPILFSAPMVQALLAGRKTQTRRVMKFLPYVTDDDVLKYCPYGQPGDRLWVKETWQASRLFDLCPPRDIPPESDIRYAADAVGWNACARTRPSIFMPRWASRILLEVVSVRVERLQAVSDLDALKEGAPDHVMNGGTRHAHPRFWFKWLWEQINGAGSWDANPWVWVVEFKRIE